MNTTVTSYSSEHSWLASGSRRGSIESILSIQGKETDFVQDTSDTCDALSDEERDLEYEPVTEPEDDGPIDGDTSGESDNEVISTKVIEVSVGEDGDLVFADSEQTDSDGTDSEIDLYDYWKCAQCRAQNNNPLYRYCEKCFKVRKNFFPPRPRPKQQRCKPKTNSCAPISVHSLTDSGIDSAFNSQELSQATPDREIDGKTDDFQSRSQTESLATEVTVSNNLKETLVVNKQFLGPSTSYNQHLNPNKDKLERIINKNITISQKDENEKVDIDQEKRNIKNKAYLKRRAESADRNQKRLKIDYSESDTESSDNDRTRKSKSLDPVSPLIKTISDPSLTIDTDTMRKDDLCIICVKEPKSGVFVHGRIAHICCCYKCAVKVWSKSKRCPICNCKVSNVLKAVVM